MKVYNHPAHSNVTVVELPKKEIKKIDFALCKQPKETLKSYYDRQDTKPDFLMNGGFFNMSDGKTCFNFVDEGEDIVSGHWYELGIGVSGDNTLEYGNVTVHAWRDFVAAYPPLIEDGKACSTAIAKDLNYKARRSVLAYDDTRVYLIAVEGSGMKFEAVQKLLLDMGVTHAIGLDGGGSTKILQDGISITSKLYNRAVDNVIAVYLKPIRHRVQVGAWKTHLYALNMQAKIRKFPDPLIAGYAGARCVKRDGWWKVQVGAYSTREQAERVEAHLATLGVTDTLITTKD